MRKILDRMFDNKKFSILTPILISTLLYLLFIFLGKADDKTDILIATPIVSVFWFFGVFFVIYVQVKNKSCPEGFLNFVEFTVAFLFGIYSLSDAISFVINGFQNFTPLTAAGLLTYASVAWAHSKRSK